MSASRTRVLAIALDACDPGLVRELAAAGEMPVMARLLSEGARVGTLGPEGVFVGATWPTIFTATRPDRHRFLCWEAYAAGTYRHRLTTPDEIRGTPLWATLSEAGRRVAVFDVPHSRVTPLNGAMVSEFGGHDRHFGPASWPVNLVGELLERHGHHPGSVPDHGVPQFAPCDYAHREGSRRSAAETITLFEELCAGVEAKQAASLELLDRGGWDLFFTVFGESHCVGHQLWHLHDPGHPFHDADLAPAVEGDPVTAIYRRLDHAVGEHMARLGPDDTAYVLLAHGMAARHDGTHLLEPILGRLDRWLDHPDGVGAVTRMAGAATGVLPSALRAPVLRRAAPFLRRRARDGIAIPETDHAFRRWFQVPNNTVTGALRLNLAGREPHGRVLPGDRRDVLRWLSDRFAELVNVDTGGPVVDRCVIADEVYRRSDDDEMPDLFIEWCHDAPIERVWSPATATVCGPYDHWRQGDHSREGMLLAVGPGIQPGRRRRVVGLEDVGATLAASTGVVLPEADGAVIESILPASSRGPVARRAPARRIRRPAAAAVERSERWRTPAWSTRQDPALQRLRTELAGVDPALNELRAGLARMDPVLDEVRAGTAAASDRAHRVHLATDQRADAMQAHIDGTGTRVGQLERDAAIWTMHAWLPHAAVAEDQLISVVLPTRDRRALLEHAIASVEAQSYSRWELLIVDDGSTDDTPAFLGTLTDPRVRRLRTEGVGGSAARNVALDCVSGDIVVYLDDDNRLDPDWLKAVALTFTVRPDCHTAYGARVVDDRGRLLGEAPQAQPWIHFMDWDDGAIREHNRVDMGTLAHRRSDVRFDPGLISHGDWDLLLKLAAEGPPPVAVPAIAVYYRTDSPNRLETSVTERERHLEADVVRRNLVARERERGAGHGSSPA